MHKSLRNFFLVTPVALASALPSSVQAQSYPIDCAILLCLSGGWPSSVPCARARAEFIRRITPWPIEPPLQIWRCPMGAALERQTPVNTTERLFDVVLRSRPSEDRKIDERPALPLIRVQASERADIDISGDAFDFVRSIRVYQIQYSQRENKDGECVRRDATRLGSYGIQGDYRWAASAVSDVPEASELKIPENCHPFSWRSVFVDWRDHAGTYGSEEVRY